MPLTSFINSISNLRGWTWLCYPSYPFLDDHQQIDTDNVNCVAAVKLLVIRANVCIFEATNSSAKRVD